MKVLNAKVLIKVSKEDLIQKAGILNVIQTDYQVAEVIAVGPDIPADYLGESDTIYIYPGAGKALTIDGIEYRVITANEVIVIL